MGGCRRTEQPDDGARPADRRGDPHHGVALSKGRLAHRRAVLLLRGAPGRGAAAGGVSLPRQTSRARGGNASLIGLKALGDSAIKEEREPAVLDSLLESSDALILLARVLLMTLFLITGWQKLTNFPGTVAYMKTTDAPAPELSAVIAIVVEFFFGIALVLGAFTRPLALLFCLFTLGTAFLGHRYWKLEGAERHANMLNFYKNLSITGRSEERRVGKEGRSRWWAA